MDSQLHAGTYSLYMYKFKYFDCLRGKWLRARCRCQALEIQTVSVA